MKKLIMIILPPLVIFVLINLIIKYTPYQSPAKNDLSAIGDGTPYGLMNYFKTFMPVLLVIALLTQVLIAIPLWRKIVHHPPAALGVISGVILICAVLSVGLSYVIWDSATGTGRFIHIAWFMAAVQAGYWLLDFAVLRLIDWNAFKQPVVDDEPTASHP